MDVLSQCLIDEPDTQACASYIFAHGAGAPMDSDFMAGVAVTLCQLGIRVIRFEFPYMVERRLNGKRRPPNRQPELLQCFTDVIAAVANTFREPLFIGGKSMGGRMATLLMGAEGVSAPIHGIICFGYPFHPQKKPEKLRIEHLQSIDKPVLILQGTRDALGNAEEVATYDLSNAVDVMWLPDGDHDLKPRVKSGFSHEQHKAVAIKKAHTFMSNTHYFLNKTAENNH